jgi:hypothetical protein
MGSMGSMGGMGGAGSLGGSMIGAQQGSGRRDGAQQAAAGRGGAQRGAAPRAQQGAAPRGGAQQAVRGIDQRGSAYAGARPSSADTTMLMNRAQNIKWNLDMNVSYDPKMALKGRMIDRLEEIDKTLVNMTISETPASPRLTRTLGKEIDAIHTALETQGDGYRPPPIDRPNTSYSRFDTGPSLSVYGMPSPNERYISDSLPAIVPPNSSSSNGRVSMVGPYNVGNDGRIQMSITGGNHMSYGSATPSNHNVGMQGMNRPVNKNAYHVNHRGANSAGGRPSGAHMGTHHAAEGFGCVTMPNAPQRQVDSMSRPGFQMNDSRLEQRASASAFDPSTVGGPNWKKRAQDLCEQVGSAGLAPPGNFGCIEDQTTVSKDYSWKGNYEMVCKRLADTWGGWYPEMMGCPPPTNKFQSH